MRTACGLRLAMLCGLAAAGPGYGQCQNLRWTREFSAPGSGLSDPQAYAMAVFDADGPGPGVPELYVGGYFATAGGVASPGLARWDGHRWAGVGGGVGHPTMTAYITGLGLHDPDGDGPLPPVLVVAGVFESAGGVAAHSIATWDGRAWSALGAGQPSLGFSTAIVDFDEDGPGPAGPSLVIGRGMGIAAVRRWDGAQWSNVGSAPPYDVWALAVYDEDGPGPQPARLFAAIDATPGLLRWDGVSWTVVGGGLNRSALHRCAALCVVDEDGPGPGLPTLLAGGDFLFAGGIPASCVARWDGQAWSAMGPGLPYQVEAICAVDSTGGSGAPTVYAAQAGGRIHRWEPGSQTWTLIGEAGTPVTGATLFQLAGFDEDGAAGSPPALYAGSAYMTAVSGVPSEGLARYGCACYANCDGSVVAPIVNVNDFTCFLNRYAAGEAYANCDGSMTPPVLNVNDFGCFLNRFAGGCP